MSGVDRIGVMGAGLAAAYVLAARGRKVICFDKKPWLGGKAGIGPSSKLS